MSDLISKYKILPNENLVIEFHRGILRVEPYMEFKKALLKDPLFKPDLNHFIHFKNVVFKTPPSDISNFVGYIKENVQSYGKRRIAFITNTPNQVVSTTMYKIMLDNNSLNCEIFSTNETALKWLNPPTLKNKELICILNELEA